MPAPTVRFTSAQAPRKLLGAPWEKCPEKVGVPRVPRRCPEAKSPHKSGRPESAPTKLCSAPSVCAPSKRGALTGHGSQSHGGLHE